MSSESDPVVVHSGGCHCRRVRWEVEAPASVAAGTCNCSNCAMSGITFFTIPNARFRLQGGSQEFLSTYSFGTGTAKHIFSKVCGITSFYKQRGNPDEVALSVNYIDAGTIAHIEVTEFDGKNLL
ncbi:hypothetical protein ACQ4PT_069712 [Festuca glaucescens]